MSGTLEQIGNTFIYSVNDINNSIIVNAETVASNYQLYSEKKLLILGTLPTGVTSTLLLPTSWENNNECIVNFNTGVSLPTLVYFNFEPIWLNNNPIYFEANKRYTIVFEKYFDGTNTIIKTSWGVW